MNPIGGRPEENCEKDPCKNNQQDVENIDEQDKSCDKKNGGNRPLHRR